MNCRAITIFGARYAPQRLRPFRGRSLGMNRQIQSGRQTAALISISGVNRTSLHVRPQIFYALAFAKGIENPKAEEAAY